MWNQAALGHWDLNRSHSAIVCQLEWIKPTLQTQNTLGRASEKPTPAGLFGAFQDEHPLRAFETLVRS